jgi:hypothetical protein
MPAVSADEQDLERLDSEQRRHIRTFILRWDRVMRPQHGASCMLSHNAWLAGKFAPHF